MPKKMLSAIFRGFVVLLVLCTHAEGVRPLLRGNEPSAPAGANGAARRLASAVTPQGAGRRLAAASQVGRDTYMHNDWLRQEYGYYGTAGAASTFGSGNSDALTTSLRYGADPAVDAGWGGISLSSLQDRSERIFTRSSGSDPFDF